MGIPKLMEDELFRAAVRGDIRILSEANISRHGYSYFIDQTTPENNNIIHLAAQYDQYKFIEKAVSVFPELISRKNIKNDTPLHVAARTGNKKTVDVLISCSGCATKEQSQVKEDWLWMAKNSEGNTPLHLALCSNKLNVAMDLLKVGSFKVLSMLNDSQETPQHIFLRYCSGKHTTASTLLEEGVLNLQGLYMAQGDDIQGVTKELLKYTPAMCVRDSKGLTPLLIAAQEGNWLAVHHIVSRCPQSAEVCDPDGRTVLHLLKNLPLEKIAWEEEVDALKSLDFPFIRYKELMEFINIPEINALKDMKDCHGNTPAHAAVEAQAFVLVRILIECFADFTIKNKNGVSALDILKSLPDFPMKMEELRLTEIVKSKPMDTELMEASIKGDVSFFEKVGQRDVESGEIKYNDGYFLSQTSQGYSILHLAINCGHFKFIEQAINHFPTLVLTTDCNGETPLHHAARLKSNHLVAATLLRLTKDNIDKFKEEAGDKFLHALPWRQKNSDGNLPIHEAICSSNYDIAIALMQIDPKSTTFQNRMGETTLHLLARYGTYTRFDHLGNLIKQLMGLNGGLTRDTDGFTPLLRAANCGRFRVAHQIALHCPESVRCRDSNGRTFLHLLRVVPNVEVDATYDILNTYREMGLHMVTDGLRRAQDFDGNTPLHFAIKNKNFAAAKCLLLCCIGAQVRTELTITDNEGHSVADLLAALADDTPEVKELQDMALLAQRQLKETAFSIKMMEAKVYRAAVKGDMDLFDSHKNATIEEGGSDGQISGVENDSNFLAQAPDGQISGLDNDSKFLSQAPDGSNILHIAIQHSQEEFVKKAIERYPDLIFEVDCNGDTPLHIAAKFYTKDFKEQLKYIDDHCKNLVQEFNQETFMYPWRMKNSLGNTPLHEAMQSFAFLDAEFLLSLDPESTLSVNDAGETPLHVFARRGFYSPGWTKIDILELLLSKNSSAALMRDREGLTPLLRAAKSGRLLVAHTILSHCPQSIQLRDLSGRSFLHLLQFTGPECDDTFDEKIGYSKMAKPLFNIPEVDFLRNAEDCDGNTPLHFSIKNGKSTTTKLIAQRFMETDEDEVMSQMIMRNNEGQTVADLVALHDDAPNEVLQLFSKKLGLASPARSSYGICRTQIKEMANTLSVVAALLATLTFAAAFQVPGGYDDDGTPILLRKVAFQVFMISNTCALCGSMAILFSLTWVMFTGKTVDSFIMLDLSISMLYLSFNATLVAFMTGVYVAISHKNLWLAVLICALCSTVIVLMRKSFILHITRFLRLIFNLISMIRLLSIDDLVELDEALSHRGEEEVVQTSNISEK